MQRLQFRHQHDAFLLVGIHPATAVGTDLLYAAATKATGTAVHGWKRTVDWRIAGKLAADSVPAAVATLLAMRTYGMQSQGDSALISTLLSAALLLTALSLVFRARLMAFSAHHAPISPTMQSVPTIVTGGVLGVLALVSSVGAGALGVTALIMLYPRIPVARIVGSDIAHAVQLTLVAGLRPLAARLGRLAHSGKPPRRLPPRHRHGQRDSAKGAGGGVAGDAGLRAGGGGGQVAAAVRGISLHGRRGRQFTVTVALTVMLSAPRTP